MNGYKQTCRHNVNMYGVRRIIDAFCNHVNALRDCGKISAEVAERQTNMAADVELDFEDHAATAKTFEAFEKIKDYNRKHNLAA